VSEGWRKLLNILAPAADTIRREILKGEILVISEHMHTLTQEDVAIGTERLDNGEEFLLSHRVDTLSGCHLPGEEGNGAQLSIRPLKDGAPNLTLGRIHVDLKGQREVRISQKR